jgi:uncharacterized Zn finger protein
VIVRWSEPALGARDRLRACFRLELMPQQIDEAFQTARASLFPKQRKDLVTNCSCPDWGDPCKQVAATHYVLGEALDRDPFLLFELRGRTGAQVLDALRAARGAAQQTAPRGRKTRRVAPQGNELPDIPKVTLGKLEASAYDKSREALPALHFRA